jgi:hypothetical protein
MPTKTFLITTPDYEDAIDCCSQWSKEIIDLAETKGFNVVNLKRDKANKSELESRILSSDPIFVMFNGHGSPTEIYGHDWAILLAINDNEKLMKERIVYARSCFSLSKLGVSCCKHGATAFIGYGIPFMFVSDPNRSANPLKDELATPCLETSNSIPIALLKGNTVKEAVSRCKEHTDKLIASWKTKKDMEASIVVACLMWNKNALNFEGNADATIN